MLKARLPDYPIGALPVATIEPCVLARPSSTVGTRRPNGVGANLPASVAPQTSARASIYYLGYTCHYIFERRKNTFTSQKF